MLLKGPIDALNIERDVLSLAQKLLRALKALLKLLERGMRQAREIARLIDEHLRFILELCDLVVDLLQRARGSEHVLRVIGRIIDDPSEAKLSMRRRDEDRRQGDGHRQHCRGRE